MLLTWLNTLNRCDRMVKVFSCISWISKANFSLRRCTIWNWYLSLWIDWPFVCVVSVWAHVCPRKCELSMFHTNPEICNSALRRPGAGRQLCRDWVTRDAGALLWRRAPLHTELWQEVRATLCPQSNLSTFHILHFAAINGLGLAC